MRLKSSILAFALLAVLGVRKPSNNQKTTSFEVVFGSLDLRRLLSRFLTVKISITNYKILSRDGREGNRTPETNLSRIGSSQTAPISNLLYHSV